MSEKFEPVPTFHPSAVGDKALSVCCPYCGDEHVRIVSMTFDLVVEDDEDDADDAEWRPRVLVRFLCQFGCDEKGPLVLAIEDDPDLPLVRMRWLSSTSPKN